MRLSPRRGDLQQLLGPLVSGETPASSSFWTCSPSAASLHMTLARSAGRYMSANAPAVLLRKHLGSPRGKGAATMWSGECWICFTRVKSFPSCAAFCSCGHLFAREYFSPTSHPALSSSILVDHAAVYPRILNSMWSRNCPRVKSKLAAQRLDRMMTRRFCTSATFRDIRGSRKVLPDGSTGPDRDTHRGSVSDMLTGSTEDLRYGTL